LKTHPNAKLCVTQLNIQKCRGDPKKSSTPEIKYKTPQPKQSTLIPYTIPHHFETAKKEEPTKIFISAMNPYHELLKSTRIYLNISNDIIASNIRQFILLLKGEIKSDITQGIDYVVVHPVDPQVIENIKQIVSQTKSLARIVSIDWLIQIRTSLSWVIPTKYIL
jgi:hypothetical protein